MDLKNKDLFRQQNLISGKWVDVGSAGIDVLNPFTKQVIGRVPVTSASDIRNNIEFAAKAQKQWAKQPVMFRSNIMMKWHDLIAQNKQDLATIMTSEQGKPLAEALGEVDFSLSFIRWFAEEARRTYGTMIPAPTNDRKLMVLKQPIGVTAAITPWNFPAGMLARKAAPALACGCAMVVKPASETPFTALAMAYLAEQAGVPEGLLSVVTGKASEIAGEIMSNSTVKKVSFTGSTQIGKLLMGQSGETVKKLSLELGGNAPFIVFDDADLDVAANNLIAGKIRNCGQTCVTPNRIFVQSGIHDKFVEKFTEKVKQQKIGDGLDEATNIGPLVSEQQSTDVQNILNDALAKGANMIVEGGRVDDTNLFKPAVLTNVNKDMDCVKEEIFGPLVPIIKFDNVAEVIAEANSTQYGLAGYFFTQDLQKLFEVGENLEFGLVGLNTVAISTAEAPFGGRKESGIGVEGSSAGIEEYMVQKYICIGGF